MFVSIFTYNSNISNSNSENKPDMKSGSIEPSLICHQNSIKGPQILRFKDRFWLGLYTPYYKLT